MQPNILITGTPGECLALEIVKEDLLMWGDKVLERLLQLRVWQQIQDLDISS